MARGAEQKQPRRSAEAVRVCGRDRWSVATHPTCPCFTHTCLHQKLYHFTGRNTIVVRVFQNILDLSAPEAIGQPGRQIVRRFVVRRLLGRRHLDARRLVDNLLRDSRRAPPQEQHRRQLAAQPFGGRIFISGLGIEMFGPGSSDMENYTYRWAGNVGYTLVMVLDL